MWIGLLVLVLFCCMIFSFFFFNDTATTEIYTLSLHDALPICDGAIRVTFGACGDGQHELRVDRKSTRLNSSHITISYAVFCLKKKKKNIRVAFTKKKKKKKNKKKKSKTAK